MTPENQPRASFDERAAEEELDRLRQAVEESRRRHKDASLAFDKFVSSFRGVPEIRGDAEPGARRAELRAQPPVFDRPVVPEPAGRGGRVPAAAIVAGGAVILAAGVFLSRAWRTSPADSASPPASVQTSAPTAPAGGPAPAGPATREPQSTATAGVQPVSTRAAEPSELTAVRAVWVRVTVDGARVVERELDAGDRVPLRGRTIVIRAGDAGAVRMRIDGQERGPLGADGIVLTRTYTASPGR
jgi:hypothetical protein